MSAAAKNRTRRTKRATSRTTKRGSRGGSGSVASSFKAGLAIIVVVIIAFGTFLVFMNFNYQKDKNAQLQRQQELQRELNAKIQYVVTKQPIERGMEITQELLETKDFPKATKIEGAFNNVSSAGLLGKFVKNAIPAGQIILENNLQEIPLNMKLDLAENEIEVKVPVLPGDTDLYYLEKGNQISIYSLKNTMSGNRITRNVAPNARVLYFYKPEGIFNSDPKDAVKNIGKKKEPFMYLAMEKDAAKILSNEMQDNKQIKFLPEGEEAPPSTAAILQIWTGTEMEEKEVLTTIGASIASNEENDSKDYPDYGNY